MIMRLRMCCLGEVGHRQFGWLSQLLLCFRGWKVFTQLMLDIGPFKSHLGFLEDVFQSSMYQLFQGDQLDYREDSTLVSFLK